MVVTFAVRQASYLYFLVCKGTHAWLVELVMIIIPMTMKLLKRIVYRRIIRVG